MARKINEVEKMMTLCPQKRMVWINWLGQAGFLFKTSAGTTLCTDPYLSNSVEKYDGMRSRRMWFPSFLYERFQPDAVFCSHDHLDHTDPDTLPLIAAYSRAKFLGPEESCAHMLEMGIDADRIDRLTTGEVYRLGDIAITPVYARHTPGSIGALLDMEGIRFYFTGDTEFCSDLFGLKEQKIDVLLTCINGKYGNFDAKESVELALKLGVKAVIPMHYGVMPFNTVEPDEFEELCEKPDCSAIYLPRKRFSAV